MDNLILSLNVVLPLLFTMIAGYLFKHIGWLEANSIERINQLVFKVFLPCLIVINIYDTDADAISLPLIGFAMVCVILLFIALCFIVPLIEKSDAKRGVLIQGIFRSNFVLFGMPITINLLGEGNGGSTALLISMAVPVFNALAVIALELYGKEKTSYKKILTGIAKNPLIIASVIGLALLLLKIKMPIAIYRAVNDFGKVSTPMALMALGATFAFSDVRCNIRQIIIGVTGRLVIVPAIFLPIAIALGFRGAELIALMVYFGAPVAVSSYTMAAQMDCDDMLAGQLIVFGAIFSVITLFIWIYLLKTMGYI